MKNSDKTINLALQNPSDFILSYKVATIDEYNNLLVKAGFTKLVEILKNVYKDTYSAEYPKNGDEIVRTLCCDRIIVLNLIEQSFIHGMPYAIIMDYDI